ncbi:MAG: SDR family oxidoreductase, partial [Mogibacterium sp.]|nr:SDR family oxidoreductase [Mogibacterium sp.]
MEGYDFFTKNVLITGGSRGIGAETVRLFCEKGANVVFFYNKSETAAMLIEEDTRAKGIRCDVGCDESVKEAMAEAKKIFDGPIDVLVCNAGISDFNLVTDIGAERWNRIMDVNLNG